jgi:nicotinamidase-related amidase
MEKEALVVIDLQVGIQSEGNSLYHIKNVLEGVNERIRIFRENENPIIFIQHNDEELVLESPGWHIN